MSPRRMIGIRLEAEEETLIRSVLDVWDEQRKAGAGLFSGKRWSPTLGEFIRCAALKQAQALNVKRNLEAKRTQRINETSNEPIERGDP